MRKKKKKKNNVSHENEDYEFQGILDRMSETEEGVHISDLIATHELTGEEQILKVIVAKGSFGQALDEAISALVQGEAVEIHPVMDCDCFNVEVPESA